MPFPGQVAGKCPSLDRLLANALLWKGCWQTPFHGQVAIKRPSLDRLLANALPWTGFWQIPYPGQISGKYPSLDRFLVNALPRTGCCQMPFPGQVALKCCTLDRLLSNALPWTGCWQMPFPGQVAGKCPTLNKLLSGWLSISELDQGRSQDPKRGWTAIFEHSSLTFDLVTHREMFPRSVLWPVTLLISRPDVTFVVSIKNGPLIPLIKWNGSYKRVHSYQSPLFGFAPKFTTNFDCHVLSYFS